MSQERAEPGFTALPSFCVAPWASLHLDPVGRRALCCVAEPAPARESALGHAEFLNSDYVKDIRRTMMAGELPPACQACIRPNSPNVAKDFLNDEFRDLFPGLEERTLKDGSLLPRTDGGLGIVYLDYRGHACNLRCKTCGPESSSAWLKQMENQPEIWRDFFSPEGVSAVRAAVSDSPYEREMAELARLESIRKIYFAGGEPLLSTPHWKALDALIATGRAGQICLVYNTNLSFPEATIRKFTERLSHFANCKILCSIDGTPETTEYLRTGMDFGLFNRNLGILREANVGVELDLTVTSLTFTELRELSEMFLRLGHDIRAKAMIHATAKARFLRCEFLPTAVREEIARDWYEYLDQLSSTQRERLEPLRQTVTLAVALPEFPTPKKNWVLKQIEAHERGFPGKGFTERLLAHASIRAWFENW